MPEILELIFRAILEALVLGGVLLFVGWKTVGHITPPPSSNSYFKWKANFRCDSYYSLDDRAHAGPLAVRFSEWLLPDTIHSLCYVFDFYT